MNYVASREPFPLSPHIEERIYNGFPGPNDEMRMAAFHKASWSDRFAIVQSFEDERLRWFGLRLIYVEARAVLPESARLEIEDRLASQLIGDGTGCLTYEQALAETGKLLAEVVDADGLLAQYRLYLQGRSARAAAFRARRGA
jgi:exodeoxyribonuclease-1